MTSDMEVRMAFRPLHGMSFAFEYRQTNVISILVRGPTRRSATRRWPIVRLATQRAIAPILRNRNDPETLRGAKSDTPVEPFGRPIYCLAGSNQNSPLEHKLRLDAWGMNRLACRLKL